VCSNGSLALSDESGAAGQFRVPACDDCRVGVKGGPRNAHVFLDNGELCRYIASF